MTDETWIPTEGKVVEDSDRGARYDGVVYYPPEWIVVVENKPNSKHIWEEQLDPNLPDGNEVRVDPRHVVILWRTVVQRVSFLLERKMLGGAEQRLAEDFADFVDAHFPFLNPYTKLGICKENEYLLKKRLASVMRSIVDRHGEQWSFAEDHIEIASGPVSRIYLWPQIHEAGDWDLVLQMYPGNTMSQARELYGNLSLPAMRQLEAASWTIVPDMHFAFVATNVCWSRPEMVATEYAEYWKRNEQEIRQVSRDASSFRDLFAKLMRERLAREGDRESFEKEFVQSQRGNLRICPGLNMTYVWSKEAAIHHDAGGELEDIVCGKIHDALDIWSRASSVDGVNET